MLIDPARLRFLSLLPAVALALTAGVRGEAMPEAVRDVLRVRCLECHASDVRKGELDLEGSDIAREPMVWEEVLRQVRSGEMPPKKADPLTDEEKARLCAWVEQRLEALALADAGDPGPVVLRRLSNAEYTATVRDLTGVPTLDPAREFPVDGAAGEGFTNAGAALVMSPALLTKYLDAARQMAAHAVLLPDGVRFSASASPQDWTEEAMMRIREFYARWTVPDAVPREVPGAGRVETRGGGLPLAAYLAAAQGKGAPDGLSPRYLDTLTNFLRAGEASPLMDPLRAKFREGTLTAADIDAWRRVLWRFSPVGHIGKVNGPKAWQEPVDPVADRQEFKVPLGGAEGDVFVRMVAGTAGDGAEGDAVVWEGARLVMPGLPEVPVAALPDFMAHVARARSGVLAETERCLAVLAGGMEPADAAALAAWRAWLGREAIGPLIPRRADQLSGQAAVGGWVGDEALSAVANAGDADARIPGLVRPHSVAVHPSPSRAAVVAWRSPVAGALRIGGQVTDAHIDCGNGIRWALEVRRGAAVEVLASGASEGAKEAALGPFEGVRVAAGDVVALVIRPGDGDHTCDLTAVQLTLTDGKASWDLARDVSGDIARSNPHGPWHFASEPAVREPADLPGPVAAWVREPTPARAAAVRAHLSHDLPLTHPLLAPALRAFKVPDKSSALAAQAPSVTTLRIPAEFAAGAELRVTGRMAPGAAGSVQLMVSAGDTGPPSESLVPGLPVIAGNGSAGRRRMEAEFAAFREVFPAALCYASIVPYDEVVTLRLVHREDEALRRLVLNDAEARELDRLWDELLFIGEFPLKQVDAYEQLWQYATQDADPSAFEPLRAPIMEAAAAFRKRQADAERAQKAALRALAERAWRRGLTSAEAAALDRFPTRLMLVRILTSPSFLYRSEKARDTTGPVNDWELAARLSYFLWSSVPDDALRRTAAEGRLSDPDVLAGEARRLLASDKVRRLAEEFGCRWLHVADVATLDEKSERHFPGFTAVRASMQEEVTRCFMDLFASNRPVLDLLEADDSFLDAALAAHYGMIAPAQPWQRVSGLRETGRGGLLGWGATLAKHAGASRTSAILRGTWVSEVLLGEKLPVPPKGVPVLPDEAPPDLTERQLIERHSTDANCVGCHRRIDPYGFALEGFDAIGRRREADTRTTLPDGTAVSGMAELRQWLATARREAFLRQFSRKLLGYALGRSVRLSDRPLLDAMVAGGNPRAADLVEMIVRSPQFRNVRGRDAAGKP